MKWCKVAALSIAMCAITDGCTASRPGNSPRLVRVMTYNIHHAEGMDGAVDVRRIAGVINAEKADIVALQEVDRGVDRSGKIDIMTELADLTGLTYAFGKNINHGGGEYGNGILTRFPILEERNLHYRMVRGGEQRGLLSLVVDIDGMEIAVMNTHLDHREDPEERLAQVGELLQAANRRRPRPAVLCGDFNDLPESEAIRSLRHEFRDAWVSAGNEEPGYSYPADHPARRIDYIFLSVNNAGEMQLHPRFAGVIRTTASDHLPLVAELEIIIP